MTDFISSIFKVSFSLILVSLFISGCSGDKSSKTDKTQSGSVADSTQRDEPQSPGSLPPNTAHILGHVNSVETANKSDIKVDVEIKKIVGYGPSTKPLAESRVISLTTSKDFLTKENLQLAKGDSLSLIVSQSMTLGENKSSTWRIVDIK